VVRVYWAQTHKHAEIPLPYGLHSITIFLHDLQENSWWLPWNLTSRFKTNSWIHCILHFHAWLLLQKTQITQDNSLVWLSKPGCLIRYCRTTNRSRFTLRPHRRSRNISRSQFPIVSIKYHPRGIFSPWCTAKVTAEKHRKNASTTRISKRKTNSLRRSTRVSESKEVYWWFHFPCLPHDFWCLSSGNQDTLRFFFGV